MLVFTRQGFFSVVQDFRDKGHVWIRARVRADMDAMVDMIAALTKGFRPKVLKTPDRDYMFRIMVPKEIWAEVAERTALEIDYPNFKASLHGQDPIRDSLMMDVWARLVRYQEQQAQADRIRKGKR